MSTQPQQEEEQGTSDYVVALLYGVLALWAVYTTFIVAGAVLGAVIDGPIRLAVAVGLALVFPILTAMGGNARKEQATGVQIVSRIFIGAIILSFGTAVIIGVTMADKVVPRLMNDPNWFVNDPHAVQGPPAINRRYSAIVADGFGRLAHAAGTYYYPGAR